MTFVLDSICLSLKRFVTCCERHGRVWTIIILSSLPLSSDDIRSFLTAESHLLRCSSANFLLLISAVSRSFFFCSKK